MSQSLLDGLASEAEREQELSSLEEELARYSAGELEPSRIAELQQMALDDRDLHALLEAHRPLSAAERQHLLRSVEHALATPGAAPSQSESETQRGLKSGVVRLWPLIAPLAVAAGVALWFSGGPPTAELAWPRYQLETRQGSREFRDGAAPASSAQGSGTPAGAMPRLERSGRLTLVLRPETATSARPAAFVFVSRPGGELEPWTHREERASSGALQLTLTRLSELPAGGQLIVILHAATEVDPARVLALARGTIERGPDWQRWVLGLDTARR